MIWETGEAEEWIDKEKELYFYSNLEALMAEKGLSIAELSERTGVAQSTIRSLIRGRPNQYPLEYCGVGEAIAVLREQYVVGTVTAKIVQPKPDELKIFP